MRSIYQRIANWVVLKNIEKLAATIGIVLLIVAGGAKCEKLRTRFENLDQRLRDLSAAFSQREVLWFSTANRPDQTHPQFPEAAYPLVPQSTADENARLRSLLAQAETTIDSQAKTIRELSTAKAQLEHNIVVERELVQNACNFAQKLQTLLFEDDQQDIPMKSLLRGLGETVSGILRLESPARVPEKKKTREMEIRLEADDLLTRCKALDPDFRSVPATVINPCPVLLPDDRSQRTGSGTF